MRRFVTAFRTFASVVLLATTFVSVAVCGAWIHRELPPSRRLAITKANALLLDMYQGRVTLIKFDRWAVVGFDGVQLTATDPDGESSVSIDGLSVRLAVAPLLRSWWSGPGDVNVTLSEIHVARAEIAFGEDAPSAAEHKIVLKEPPVQREGEASHPSRGVHLVLPKVTIDQLRVRRRRKGAPPVEVEFDVVRATAERTPFQVDLTWNEAAFVIRGIAPVEGKGTVSGRLTLPSLGEPNGWIVCEGQFGDVRPSFRASVEGANVNVHGVIPRAEGGAFRALIPGLHLNDAADLRVDVGGVLPHLKAHANLGVGEGQLAMDAGIILGQRDAEMTVVFRASALDTGAFFTDMPKSKWRGLVNANLTASLDGTVTGRFDLDASPTPFRRNHVPIVAAKGSFTEATFETCGTISELKAMSRFSLSLRPESPNTHGLGIDFMGSGMAPDLRRIAWLGKHTRGKFRFGTKGYVALDGSKIDLSVDAKGVGISRGRFGIGSASLVASVAGSMDAATLEARVTGGQLGWKAHRIATFGIEAHGPLLGPHVVVRSNGGNLPAFKGTTDVHTRGGIALRNTQVSLRRGNVKLVARAPSIALSESMISLEEIELEGIGNKARASFRRTPSTMHVAIRAPAIDLTKVAALVHRENRVRSGRLSIEGDFTASRDGRDAGRLRAHLEKGSFDRIDNLNVDLTARIRDAEFEGALRGTLGDIGWMQVRAPRVQLDGSPLDRQTWHRAIGELTARAHANLLNISAIAPEGFPVDGIPGTLDLTVAVIGRGAYPAPDVHLAAWTRGLDIARLGHDRETRTPEATIDEEQGERTSKMDGRILASLNGETGDAKVSGIAWDRHGTLLEAGVTSSVPVNSVLDTPLQMWLALKETPYRLSVVAPRRPLAHAPAILGKFPMDGRIETEGVVTYDGARASVQALGFYKQHAVLHGSAKIAIRTADLLSRTRASRSWSARTRVALNEFPLESLFVWGGLPIHGRVSGQASVKDWGQDARMEGKFHGEQLTVGEQPLPKFEIQAMAQEEAFRVKARLEQPGGQAEMHSLAKIDWGSAFIPTMKSDRSIDLSYEIQNFRLCPFLPWVNKTFRRFDGWIDGTGKLHSQSNGRDSSVEGHVTLRDGLVHMPALGGEWKDIGARLRAERTGNVTLENASARGVTGKVTISGAATLAGLDLKSAFAFLRVPKEDKVPVLVEGQTLGELWGNVDLFAKEVGARKLNLDVVIPTLHFELPEFAARGVQTLDDDETIAIGYHAANGNHRILRRNATEAVDDERPKEPFRIHARVILGDDVFITQGTSLNMQLDGKPDVDVADGFSISGQVDVNAGIIEIQGKRFAVEYGTITFVGDDQKNPMVMARARWEAPDHTEVYADFVGPLKTGKLSLHSDPAHTQNEILGLLLFGSADAVSSSMFVQNDQTVGLASGLMTPRLNRALSSLTGLNVSTRLETNEYNKLRPEVRIQISNQVSAKAGYNLGAVAPGETADRTILMLNWHFLRRWSLATTFGDRGTSMVDIFWDFRH